LPRRGGGCCATATRTAQWLRVQPPT
jgi:hypothetical protein